MPTIKPRLLLVTILVTTTIFILAKQLAILSPIFNKDISNQISQNIFKSTETVKLAYAFTPIIWESNEEFLSLDSLKTLTVFADENKYQTRLLDARGEEVDLPVVLNANPFGSVQVEIPPPRNFKPGKYSLEVSYNKITQSKDFTWGVLAINTNKSIYAPYETADISLSVLDNLGNMVCDADVNLSITYLPQGRRNGITKTTNLTTQTGNIKINSECLLKEKTQKPDYETFYITEGVGVYELSLTATTNSGSYTIYDTFTVQERVPFDIERISATRIYPKENYPVIIEVGVNENFKGTLIESLPNTFTVLEAYIVNSSESIQNISINDSPNQEITNSLLEPMKIRPLISVSDNEILLKWDVDWEKGETYSIYYLYDAVNISPELYVLGPLELYKDSNSVYFKEGRQWSIASDALSFVEKTETFTASSSGSWVDFNLSGAPYNVPANAVVQIVAGNVQYNAERYVGVRANGSTNDRRVLLREAEGATLANGVNGASVVTMYAQADANSIIEVYAQTNTVIGFYLMGYWEDVTFTETWASFSTGANTTWTDINLNTYGVGSEEIAEIITVNNNQSAPVEAGVRSNGSSISRIIDIQESEAGGVDAVAFTVKADATSNATIEAYSELNTNILFYISGYWDSPPGDYTEKFETLSNPTTDNTWTDSDLSGSPYLVPANSVVDVLVSNGDTNAFNNMGARSNGSSLSRFVSLMETEANGREAMKLMTTTDAGSFIEILHEDVSDTPFTYYLMGYWEEVIPVPTNVTLYNNDGGSNQIAFTNIRDNSVTPIFRVSASNVVDINRFQIELNSASDFSATAYLETFTGTYSTDTEYNLQTTGSLSLPTDNGITYYVRLRASSDAGTSWSDWTDSTWTYTYTSTSGLTDWFQSTDEQFDTGTFVDTATSGFGSVISTGGDPIVRNIEATGTYNPGSGNALSDEFTPPSNSLLVVIANGGGTTSTLFNWNPTIVDSEGLTWTEEVENTRSDSFWTYGSTIWTAESSSSVPMSIIIDHGSETVETLNITILSIENYNTSDPIGGISNDNNFSDGAESITLSETPLQSSLVIGALDAHLSSSGVNNALPGSDFNEIVDFGDSTMWAYLQVQERSESTSTTVSWIDTHSSGGTWFAGSAVAIEIHAQNLSSSGTIMSSPINYDMYDGAVAWGNIQWSATETNGSVLLQVYYSDGSDCDTLIPDGDLTGNSSGFSINTIDISNLDTSTYDSLCLLATLNYSGGSPSLESWEVSWLESVPIGSQSTAQSFQRKTFYDGVNESYWQFYHDGTEIAIEYSMNAGTSWTPISNLSYDTNDFSIWHSSISGNEYVWIAIADNNDVVVHRGTLSTSDISWDGTSQVAFNGTSSSDTYSYPFITLDSSNYLWLVARYYNGADYALFSVDSANTGNSTWSSLTWNSSYQLSAAQGDANVFGNIVPLASQDMYAAFISDTSLEGCTWDDSDDRWENSSGGACFGSFESGDASDGSISISSSINCSTTDISSADGDVTADCIAVAINAASGNGETNADRIEITSTAGFTAGDEVFVTQVSGTGSGNYEFCSVSTIQTNDYLDCEDNLSYTYQSTGAQVVRVPQYEDVTINSDGTLTVDAWDGSSGGILVFKSSGIVSINSGGLIDLNGKGFSGGATRTGGTGGGGGIAPSGAGSSGQTSQTGNNGSGAGAGIAGVGNADDNGKGASTSNRGGGGAGGSGGGGGGGSYGSTGSAGSSGSSGTGGSGGSTGGAGGTGSSGAGGSTNSTYGVANLTALYLGSGGGSGAGGAGGGGGSSDNSTNNGGSGANGGDGGAGGAGGGVVYIYANSINVEGGIQAKGAVGNNGANGTQGSSTTVSGGAGGGSAPGAGGGGGSGGSILLGADSISIGSSLVDAGGGIAGSGGSTGGSGGNSPSRFGGSGSTGAAGGGASTAQNGGSASGGSAGSGGAGGNGRIHIDYTTNLTGTSSPSADTSVLSGTGTSDSIDDIPNGVEKNMSLVSDTVNNDVHLVYISDETTDQVSYKRWDSGTKTWDSSPTLVADAASVNDAHVTLTLDSNTNDLYALWIDTSTNNIFYSSCSISSECNTSGEWLAENEWQTETAPKYLNSNFTGDQNVFAQWTDGISSPYVVEWDIILQPSTGITVSGIIYSDEAVTEYDCSSNNLTIKVSINGNVADTGTCTSAGGTYSISTSAPPSSVGDPLIVYIDSSESPQASTVTRAASTSSNINDLDLYLDTVIVRHHDSGPITNSDLGTADNSDAGIRYSVSSSNITIDSGFELHVHNNNTYDPNGIITTQGSGGDVHLGTTSTAYFDTSTSTIAGDVVVDGSAALYINADSVINGGDIITSSTGSSVTTSFGTPTVTISGTGNIGGGTTPNLVFHNITTTGTGITTFISNATVNNDVTVGSNTTLRVNANSFTVNGGDVTTVSNGVVDYTSGSPQFFINGSGTVGGGNSPLHFMNLDFGDNTTDTSILASDIVVDATLTISNNQTLNAGTHDVTVGSASLADSGNVSINSNGIFTQSDGTTRILNSNGSSSIFSVLGSGTFYNLIIGAISPDNANYSFEVVGEFTVTNNFTFEDGGTGTHTFDMNLNDAQVTVLGSMSIGDNVVYLASSDATNPLSIGDDFINNGTFTHNNGTVIFDNASNTSTLTYGAATTFGELEVTTPGKSMQFDNDAQTNVTVDLTMIGNNCSTGRVFLDSDVNDSQFELNATGSYTIQYIDVEDSNAISALLATNSTEDDYGSNTNWTIDRGECSTISFNISDNSIGYGDLTTSTDRYATGDFSGSSSEVEAHTITASTNAPGGYIITVEGDSLTSYDDSYQISSIGGSNTSSTPGDEQFGIRAELTAGSGTITAPYDGLGFAFGASDGSPDQIAAGDGDNLTSTYSIRYLGNIAPETQASNYSTILTYTTTGTF